MVVVSAGGTEESRVEPIKEEEKATKVVSTTETKLQETLAQPRSTFRIARTETRYDRDLDRHFWRSGQRRSMIVYLDRCYDFPVECFERGKRNLVMQYGIQDDGVRMAYLRAGPLGHFSDLSPALSEWLEVRKYKRVRLNSSSQRSNTNTLKLVIIVIPCFNRTTFEAVVWYVVSEGNMRKIVAAVTVAPKGNGADHLSYNPKFSRLQSQNGGVGLAEISFVKGAQVTDSGC
ncbi:hypothetical protein Tco_0204581 [Tanacetum coccineum]